MNPALHDSKSVGLFQFSIPSTVLAEEMIKCELYYRLETEPISRYTFH